MVRRQKDSCEQQKDHTTQLQRATATATLSQQGSRMQQARRLKAYGGVFGDLCRGVQSFLQYRCERLNRTLMDFMWLHVLFIVVSPHSEQAQSLSASGLALNGCTRAQRFHQRPALLSQCNADTLQSLAGVLKRLTVASSSFVASQSRGPSCQKLLPAT